MRHVLHETVLLVENAILLHSENQGILAWGQVGRTRTASPSLPPPFLPLFLLILHAFALLKRNWSQIVQQKESCC